MEPPADCKMPNCFQCDICGGPVDRFEHMFICRHCQAHGDLITGIMSPSRPEDYISRNPLTGEEQ
jgi:hypothetical protein